MVITALEKASKFKLITKVIRLFCQFIFKLYVKVITWTVLKPRTDLYVCAWYFIIKLLASAT